MTFTEAVADLTLLFTDKYWCLHVDYSHYNNPPRTALFFIVYAYQSNDDMGRLAAPTLEALMAEVPAWIGRGCRDLPVNVPDELAKVDVS